MESDDHSLIQKGLHIFILFALSVAYPSFQLLTKSVAFFIAGNNQPVDLIFLSTVLSLILPGLLVTLSWIGGHRRVHARHTYLVILFLLVFAMVLPALKMILSLPAGWMF